MKCARYGSVIGLVLSLAFPGFAQTVVLEPDDFNDEDVLNEVHPLVTLSVADSEYVINPNFDVTATDDPFGFIPTGELVFGFNNIQFWNHHRRLRMDFSTPVQAVSLAFTGSLSAHVGRLELFDGAGTLLAVYETEPRIGGEVETMSLTRAAPDVAYAVAYSSEVGDFGRLDHLVFTVPEPAAGMMLGAVLLFARCRRGARAVASV